MSEKEIFQAEVSKLLGSQLFPHEMSVTDPQGTPTTLCLSGALVICH